MHKVSPCGMWMCSGIPEMKCILSGVWLKRYLGMDVFVAKVLGIILAIGSGCTIGKEGPMVHLASIAEDQLSKRIGFFNKLRRNPAMMQQLLAAACAIGVSGNFGTPFGGLLFSIEVTSTYYPIKNYYYAFITSFSGSFVFLILWNFFLGQSFFTPFFPAQNRCDRVQTFWDFVITAVIGVICGLTSVIIIKGYSGVMYLKKKYSHFFLFRRYPYTILIALLSGICTFPPLVGNVIAMPSRSFFQQETTRVLFSPPYPLGDLLKQSPSLLTPCPSSPSHPFASLCVQTMSPHRSLLRNLFDPDFRWSNFTVWPSNSFSSGDAQLPLHFYFFFLVLSRLVLQILTMPVPVPLGIFNPAQTLGAAIGYLIGISVNSVMPLVKPSMMAMVGSAATAAGLTQTLSTALLTVELTGEFDVLFPSMLGVVISMGISSTLSCDIFDTVLQLRQLPYLPALEVASFVTKAKDIMDTDYPIIHVNSITVPEMVAIQEFATKLSKERDEFSNIQFAVVDENDHFFGSIPDYVISFVLDKLKNKTIDLEQISQEFERYSVEFNEVVPPFTLSPQTTLEQVHSCFVTLRLPLAFITKDGKVLGTITREAVMYVASLGNRREIERYTTMKS
eukprot:TRINITY_DN7263_c0_g1_i17.p1 TRINITY_DN7263_c0_g1~~TRINITY_DN7263_c0_g1_i17.p1  ORF type:complete len:618 (+),score=99.53 TRINITY_DN7263_c0_g1_i17:604-2457(+)